MTPYSHALQPGPSIMTLFHLIAHTFFCSGECLKKLMEHEDKEEMMVSSSRELETTIPGKHAWHSTLDHTSSPPHACHRSSRTRSCLLCYACNQNCSTCMRLICQLQLSDVTLAPAGLKAMADAPAQRAHLAVVERLHIDVGGSVNN